ncbi:MAG TPA: hypothetical protein VEO54_05960 [Thermoanaerobaculia bacterium]|nr:hypothetical protein [Thermoanaerobaculia bacterium]
MSGTQITFVAASFLILAAITAFVQFRWLPPGRVQSVSVFIAGVAVVTALWIAGLPPKWFAGAKSGFGITLSFGLGALLARAGSGEKRAFGFPLLLGMSLTFLAANVLAFARRVL